MEAQPDFKELLRLFNDHGIEYLIVGGYAVAFHGAPRFTGELDLFVRPAEDNAAKIMQALTAFGFGDQGLKPADFTAADTIVQLGLPPVRINIVASLDGVSWEDAWPGRILDLYGEVSAAFIGRQQLIRNKRRCGRMKDLADIEALGEL